MTASPNRAGSRSRRLLRHIARSLRGVICLCALSLALLLAGLAFVLPVLLKILLPVTGIRRSLTRLLGHIAEGWVGVNALILRTLHRVQWQVELIGDIDPQASWLVISNHQSWTDIVVLLDVMHHRLPFPRFFLKQSLLWVPVVGAACWGLDMPFMKRHSRKAIARNPRLAEDDLRTTRRCCERYRGEPTAIVNFVEGTRETEAKRRETQSPYENLLRPKSGGLSFTLNAMGDQFAGMIDVTIDYLPTARGRSIVWSFLRGEQSALRVQAQVRPLPAAMLHGDYAGDEAFRLQFQAWLNHIWEEKDRTLSRWRAQGRS